MTLGKLGTFIEALQKLDPELPVFTDDSEAPNSQPYIFLKDVNVYEYKGPAVVIGCYLGDNEGLW